MAENYDARGLAGALSDTTGASTEGSGPAKAPVTLRTTARQAEHTRALEARLSFIFDLWQKKRGTKAMPSRAELDPADFHRLWPVTFLLEKGTTGDDWYVRFAGAAYSSVYGREITGAPVREIVPASLAPQVLADLKQCIEEHEPIVIEGETNWPDRGNVYRYQRVLLPYGTEEEGVTHLLGVAAFYNSAGATVF